jgi:hypothetical protein
MIFVFLLPLPIAFVYSADANRFCHSAAANVFYLFCRSLVPSSSSFCLFCWSLESVKRTISRDPSSIGFWFIGPTAAKIYFTDARYSTKSVNIPSTHFPLVWPNLPVLDPSASLRDWTPLPI